MYINTVTLEYPLMESDIRSLHPNVSFTRPFVPPEKYKRVNPVPQPVFNPETEVLVESEPELVDGEWVQVWVISPRYTEYTDEEGILHTVEEQIAEVQSRKKKEKWSVIRINRDRLLADSDYTQVPDYPLPLEVKEAWRTYRQALRDITEQEDPFNIEWPEVPDESAIPLLGTDWKGFNFALFTNSDFVQYGISAQTVNPYLVPSIIERYGQITKLGLTESDFADYWDTFCASLSVTAEHREIWAQLAESFHLPSDFINIIRGTNV